MTNVTQARLLQRVDTRENWEAENPVLLKGELGMVEDYADSYKVGDGLTPWNKLPYRGFNGVLSQAPGDSERSVMSQAAVTLAINTLQSLIEGLEKSSATKGELATGLAGIQSQLDALIGGNISDAIESFNEIVAFLEGIIDSETLAGALEQLRRQIAGLEETSATKEELSTLEGKTATKEELSALEGKTATKEELSTLEGKTATKEELSALEGKTATKEELSALEGKTATKEELSALEGKTATKEELSALEGKTATKEELSALEGKTATKEELSALEGKTATKEELSTLEGKTATKEELSALEGKTATKEELSTLEGKTATKEELSSSLADIKCMRNVTYADLVAFRNEGKLKAGMFYRITDYVTTTVQENTQSAGHAFDVIVMATDKRTLSEEARAIVHEGDTYFTEAGTNLAAWKVWYCLDNDQDRFVWAIKYDAIKLLYSDGMSYIYRRYKDADKDDKIAWALVESSENAAFGSVYLDKININDIVLTEQNVSSGDAIEFDGELIDIVEKIVRGKGVIYRMVDEWGNDCPYDFKNIQFKRNLNLTDGLAEFSENGEETWVYTFAGQSYHINNDECSDMLDGSLESPFGHMSDEKTSTFHDNVIKPYIKLLDWETEDRTKVGVRYLNGIVFLGYWEKIGSANEEDAPYYYAYCCYSNSFGNNCYHNSFGNGCHSNSFGNNCYHNSFGNDCHSNSFGNNCYHNSFSYGCNNNSFGNDCLDNSFGKGCVSNSFGNNCYSNSVGEDISYATLLSGVTEIEGIGQSHAMVARNSAGVVKIFNIADLVE